MISSKNILAIRKKNSDIILIIEVFDFYNMIVEDSLNDKKISYIIKNYEIMTEYGWSDLIIIRKMKNKQNIINLTTENFVLFCCNNQAFIDETGRRVSISFLNEGDLIQTELGLEKVQSIVDTKVKEEMYQIMSKTSRGSIYVMGILLVN